MSPNFRCPGSMRSATPVPIERVCSKCGAAVEMFSDEERVTCKCGAEVFRDKVPRCVEWCPAAERCLGHVLDVKAIQAEARRRAEAEGNPHYVEELCERIRAELEKKEEK